MERTPPTANDEGYAIWSDQGLEELPEISSSCASLIAPFNLLTQWTVSSISSSSFPSLRVLDLSHNALQTLPRLAEVTPRLQELKVGHNKLTDLEWLRDLPSLRVAWCHDNALSSLEATAAALSTSSESLRVLVIHNNPCLVDAALAIANEITMISSKFGKRDDSNQSKVSKQFQQQTTILGSGGGELKSPSSSSSAAAQNIKGKNRLTTSATAATTTSTLSPSGKNSEANNTDISSSSPIPTAAELYLIHHCPDLRALVARSPPLYTPPPHYHHQIHQQQQPENPHHHHHHHHHSNSNNSHSSSSSSLPTTAPSPLIPTTTQLQPLPQRASIITTVSDGSLSITPAGVKLTSLIRVTPDVISKSHSWYTAQGQAFLKQVADISIEKAKASNQKIAGSGGADPGAAAAAAAAAATTTPASRIRIPLAEVKHKVPSRYVASKMHATQSTRGDDARLAEFSKPPRAQQGGRQVNGALTDGEGEDGGEHIGTPVKGDDDEEEEEKEGGNGVSRPESSSSSSPISSAQNTLLALRSRSSGILAALAALPDLSYAGISNGSLSSAKGKGKASSSSTFSPIVATGKNDIKAGNNDEEDTAEDNGNTTTNFLPLSPAIAKNNSNNNNNNIPPVVGGMAAGLRRAALALSTSGPGATLNRTGKRKEDPELTRILKSVSAVVAGKENSSMNENNTILSGPRVVTTALLESIDDEGHLKPFTEGSTITTTTTTTMTTTNTPESSSSSASIANRSDGTCTIRWPNGALALEVSVDDRTTRGLRKWIANTKTNSTTTHAVDETEIEQQQQQYRALALTAYSREGTGKTRSLSISWDGLGAGTICAPPQATGHAGAATLAMCSDTGSGHHSDGKTGAGNGNMLRAWDNYGKVTYTAGAYENTILPPPAPAPAAATTAVTSVINSPAVAKEDTPSAPLSGEGAQEEGEANEEGTNPAAAAETISSLSTSETTAAASTTQNASISSARATVAAALAAAEATNAAIVAIMRTRALLASTGLAASGPSKGEDFGKDPRAAKVADEYLLRKTMLRLLRISSKNSGNSSSRSDDEAVLKVLPKALRTSPGYFSHLGAAFPLGQHLGVVLLFGSGRGEESEESSSSAVAVGPYIVVLLACGSTRVALRFRPSVVQVPMIASTTSITSDTDERE